MHDAAAGCVGILAMAGIALSAMGAGGYEARGTCGPFPDWQASEYVLPFVVGSTYAVSQGNCSTGGHRGAYRFAYDFVMPIGTTVTAARAGVVTEIRMKFVDGQPGEGQSNWVKVRHADGTIGAYSHLTAAFALPRVSLLGARRLRHAAGDVSQHRAESPRIAGWPELPGPAFRGGRILRGLSSRAARSRFPRAPPRRR